MRPYDRLIGAALDGDRWLFAEQDTVEAAWQKEWDNPGPAGEPGRLMVTWTAQL
jgi:hypothetical protein